MFRNLFGNIPDVTKNLLIINVLFFLATFVAQERGINLIPILGLHYPTSTFFEPYQLVTSVFMHAGFQHILFNMIGLVVFGSMLERVWGKKRFFIFYFVTAFGASLLHILVQGIELHHLMGSFAPEIWFDIQNGIPIPNGNTESFPSFVTAENINKSIEILWTPTVGASGAIYGLLMAAALLFPNTQMMLLFPPIPIKLKWLALALGIFEVYSGYQNAAGDSVAHFAHLGGMLFGFILIYIWRRDKRNFY